MYTVLLVDDEEKILEVMKVRIGWQELGVDKLLTASDGQAALMLICWQRKYESCITCLTRASGTPVIVISPRSCTSRMERMPR